MIFDVLFKIILFIMAILSFFWFVLLIGNSIFWVIYHIRKSGSYGQFPAKTLIIFIIHLVFFIILIALL